MTPCIRLIPSLLTMACLPLQAASFIVDLDLDRVDATPGDGQCDVGAAAPPDGPRCSLRAAVMEAEANAEADTLLIPAGMTINLSLSGSGGAEAGDLNISTDMVIAGYVDQPPANPDLLPVIDASALGDRHFQIVGGEVTLRGLRLQGGTSSNAGGALRVGGNASVHMAHMLLSSNRAATRGGAVAVTGPPRLTVEDSLFLRNEGGSAAAGGLSAEGSARVVIRRSTLLDNRASGVPASTLAVLGNASLRIENSTVDGSLTRPPIAGLEAAVGIAQSGSYGASELILRNVTVSGFSQTALRLDTIDGNERTRVANSVLESNGTACVTSGSNAAADVRIAYSRVQHQSGCEIFYLDGLVGSGLSDLAPLSADPPPRLTLSRQPLGIGTNVVDRGSPFEATPDDPELRCTGTDQRGNPRPVDADLDDNVRCDLGAIELPPPEPFVVDHFADDLPDATPGDGRCETLPLTASGVVCTLRAAVMEANAQPGLAHITFAHSDDPVMLTLAAAGPVGGALDITDTVAIDGNLREGRPATAISGQMVGERLFLVDAPNAPVYLRNLNLRGGDAGGRGGALAVLLGSSASVSRSEMSDNRALNGGGAIAVLGGLLSVQDSDFHANHSDSGPLGLFANFGSRISIVNSSFRDHLGFDAGGSPQSAIGIDPDVSLSAFNTTFNGNQIALHADRPDVLLLLHNTIADQLSGGVIAQLGPESQVSMLNSIVSAPASAQPDCTFSNTVMVESFNLDYVVDSDGSCAALATQIGLSADPLLGPIGRPAGHISYSRAPGANADTPSPAVDRAASEACFLDFDQYRRTRPFDLQEIADAGGPCDLGAIEVTPEAVFRDGFEAL